MERTYHDVNFTDVLPSIFYPPIRPPATHKPHAHTTTPIKLDVNLCLRRDFTPTVTIVYVNRPLIGVNFLSYCGLLTSKTRLVDNITSLAVSAQRYF